MSYILDALRKADAERAGVARPAQAPLAPGIAAGSARRGRRRLAWAAAAVSLAAALWALAWWAGDREEALPPVPVAPVAAIAAAPATPVVPEPVAAPAPEVASPVEPPASVARPEPAAERALPPPAPRSPRRAPGSAPAAKAAARTPQLAELPEAVRREVPALAIGGSVYSPQPDSRMLIVNGQVVREGETLAPGLQLERIGPKSAQFSIRGQRFEVRL